MHVTFKLQPDIQRIDNQPSNSSDSNTTTLVNTNANNNNIKSINNNNNNITKPYRSIIHSRSTLASYSGRNTPDGVMANRRITDRLNNNSNINNTVNNSCNTNSSNNDNLAMNEIRYSKDRNSNVILNSRPVGSYRTLMDNDDDNNNNNSSSNNNNNNNHNTIFMKASSSLYDMPPGSSGGVLNNKAPPCIYQAERHSQSAYSSTSYASQARLKYRKYRRMVMLTMMQVEMAHLSCSEAHMDTLNNNSNNSTSSKMMDNKGDAAQNFGKSTRVINSNNNDDIKPNVKSSNILITDNSDFINNNDMTNISNSCLNNTVYMSNTFSNNSNYNRSLSATINSNNIIHNESHKNNINNNNTNNSILNNNISNTNTNSSFKRHRFTDKSLSSTKSDAAHNNFVRIPRNVQEAMSFDCGSSTFGSCSQSDYRHDSELDVRMMRTLNDVKFKNRPKFPVFGDVNFQRECLDAHNAIRQRHGCAPLEWSQELADLARTWAEKLVEKGRVLYPELTGLGENIYLGTASDLTHLPSGQELCEQWGAESDNYDYDAPRWRPNCQHFTQIVWRDSYELGASRCWLPATGRVGVVCFYRPGGNVNNPGEFSQNVPRPLSPTELAALEQCTPLPLCLTGSSSAQQLNGTNDNHPGTSTSPIGDLPGAFRRKLLLGNESPPHSTMSDCRMTYSQRHRQPISGHNNNQSSFDCHHSNSHPGKGISASDPIAGGGCASTKSTPAKKKSGHRSTSGRRFWSKFSFSRFRRDSNKSTS